MIKDIVKDLFLAKKRDNGVWYGRKYHFEDINIIEDTEIIYSHQLIKDVLQEKGNKVFNPIKALKFKCSNDEELSIVLQRMLQFIREG